MMEMMLTQTELKAYQMINRPLMKYECKNQIKQFKKKKTLDFTKATSDIHDKFILLHISISSLISFTTGP